jgi:hypothetical protein
MESRAWSHDAAAPAFDMLLSVAHDERVVTSTTVTSHDTPSPAEQLGERVTALHPSLAAQLLTTIESQTSALAMVLAAHECGAITLPASLRSLVTAAHNHLPTILTTNGLG